MSASVEQRRRAIAEVVQSEGFVTTTQLAERFGVSEMSIRRDAEVLSARPDIVRVRGGLVSTPEVGDKPGMLAAQEAGAKERIAAAAARRVEPTSVIMIDAGSTALSFAHALPDEFHGTVITHSLPVLDLMAARPHVTTIGLGGELYCRSRAFIGTSAIAALERLRAETFFMGAAGVSPDGVFAARDVERNLKRAMMEASRRTVVLVDHRKFEAAAPVFLAGWGPRFTVLTDEVSDPKVAQCLREAGGSFEVAA